MAFVKWTAPEIFKLSAAYWPSCAVHAAVSLDLFTVLDRAEKQGRALSSAALAKRLRCNARATGMLATALVALGFLERDGETLRLAPEIGRYLSALSPEYVGFIIRHHGHIMPGWVKLAEAVRTGGRMRDNSSSDTESEEEREAFLMGMFNIAVGQADSVAASLDLSGRKRLLDLGGGPGTYAVYFCRHNAELTATVFDLPTSESFARGVIKRFDLQKRVDFTGGDFLKSKLPTGYDVAWLSQILHGESPKDAARLVKRAGKTLNRGGLLCVQEFILDDDLSGPAHSALFSLNMLVGTIGGQSYSQSEIAAMLRDAGAVNIRRVEAALPPGCGIMAGEMR